MAGVDATACQVSSAAAPRTAPRRSSHKLSISNVQVRLSSRATSARVFSNGSSEKMRADGRFRNSCFNSITEGSVNHTPTGALKPFLERDRTAAGHVCSNVRRRRILVRLVRHLQPHRQRQAERREIDVEKWRPQLQPVRHRGSIDLDQDVAGQVTANVGYQRVRHGGVSAAVIGNGMWRQPELLDVFGREPLLLVKVRLRNRRVPPPIRAPLQAAVHIDLPGEADGACQAVQHACDQEQRRRVHPLPRHVVERPVPLVVAAQELVSSVAGEHHLRMLARQTRDQERRDVRGIAERFVVHVLHLHRELGDIGVGVHQLDVSRSIQFRHRARVRQLARGAIKPERNRGERTMMADRKGHDRARIEATAQERRDR